MTLRTKHGKATYRMAWAVEISLFMMAISIAVFNLYIGWQQGSSTSIIQAVLLAVCWVAIAIVELSTIPLAGSLSLTRLREKPLTILAVVGLAFLSGWTAYEFNEAASYYMTRGAREATIQNANDSALIRHNEDLIATTFESTDLAGSRLEDAKRENKEGINRVHVRAQDAKTSIDDRVAESLASIDDQIKRHEEAMQGPPSLIQSKEDLEKLIQDKQRAHGQAIASSVGAINRRLVAISNEIAKLQKYEQSIKTGAFTGGKERKDECVRQQDELRKEQAQTNKNLLDLQSQLAGGPDISREMVELQSLRTSIAQKQDLAHTRRKNEIETLVTKRAEIQAMATEEMKRIDTEAADKLASLDGEYRQSSMDAQDLVGTKDTRIEELHQASALLTAQIIDRTQAIDSQYEPILYYRMAKWFQTGEGLPTKENYARVQWFIFAPFGAFFSIVSIALAYIGVSLQRKGNEGLDELQAAEQAARRDRELEQLKDQAGQHIKDLIRAKQETIQAIKQVPQVVKLQDPDGTRPSRAMTWLPWCACMVMSLIALGAVVYGIERSQTPNHHTVPIHVQTPDAKNQDLTIANIVSLIDPVVMIETDERRGSGFFIQPNGLLITNAHVIEGYEEVSISTHQGPTYLGKVLAVDLEVDLALVKIDATDMPTLSICIATNAHLGEDVLTVGTPLGLEWSISKGIVSSVRSNNGLTVVQTDAAMNNGNSGGPLIHLASRKVLGINTLKIDDSISDGIGFAVSAEQIRKSFPTLIGTLN